MILRDNLAAAARRGDRFVETALLRGGPLIWLAEDDPAQARARLGEARWAPPEGRFHLQHYHEVQAEAAVALYEGRAASAWPQVSPLLSQLRRSRLSLLGLVYNEAMWITAKVALAGGVEDREAVRVAERIASRLARDRAAHSQAWSGLVRGAVETRRGRPERAIGPLRLAIEAAQSSQLALCAAAAQFRLGELLGGDEGAVLLAEARTWMDSQAIRNPERMIEGIAPGFARR